MCTTREEIKDWIEHYNELSARSNKISKYSIGEDLLVNVSGNVLFKGSSIVGCLPFMFGEVSGIFDCSGLSLTSLKGCPTSVGRGFFCGSNQLKTLRYSPKYVGDNFDCSWNHLLTSLKGCPERVGGGFSCRNNNLLDLDNCPVSVGGKMDFNYNYNLLVGIIGMNFEQIKQYVSNKKLKESLDRNLGVELGKRNIGKKI